MTVSRSKCSKLYRLIDLIKTDANALDHFPLSPDGRYQTRTVTLNQLTREVTESLAEGFVNRPRDDFPTLYCSWGKCRVGSTALTNLFGVAGLPSYYQPVKTIARYKMLGADGDPWRLHSSSVKPEIYSKEMAGPYLLAETVFNPLKCLVEAGYPSERIQLLVLDRNPYKSLASWLHKWSDKRPAETLLDNFVLSSLNVSRMKRYANSKGIVITHFVYEASRKPELAIQALFNRLGLSSYYRPNLVTNWDEVGALASEKSRIIFPNEPPVYVVPGLHSSETRYLYKERDSSSLTDGQREIVSLTGLPELYEESVQACIRELEFNDEFCGGVFDQPLL
jgi:hypothetical protein